MASLTVKTTVAAAANPNQVSTWHPMSHNRRVVSHEKENSMDVNGISVWIRFAFKNITPQRVFHCLKKARLANDGELVFLGIIKRIDQVIRNDGNKMFFVHFAPNSWGKSSQAQGALKKLVAGELRVYYDDPYFWKISISRSQRPNDVDEPLQVQRPLPVPRFGTPPPASDLCDEYSSAASMVAGNELTFDPDDQSTALDLMTDFMTRGKEEEELIRGECRKEILMENGLKVTEDGEVVSANDE